MSATNVETSGKIMPKINEPFNNEDCDFMSAESFHKAIRGLIEKGILEEVILDGEVKYQLTKVGEQIGPHLTSDLAEQN